MFESEVPASSHEIACILHTNERVQPSHQFLAHRSNAGHVKVINNNITGPYLISTFWASGTDQALPETGCFICLGAFS